MMILSILLFSTAVQANPFSCTQEIVDQIKKSGCEDIIVFDPDEYGIGAIRCGNETYAGTITFKEESFKGFNVLPGAGFGEVDYTSLETGRAPSRQHRKNTGIISCTARESYWWTKDIRPWWKRLFRSA
jgi:hypothetical protein